jgi:hypothetical protein
MERLDFRHPPRDARCGLRQFHCARVDAPSFCRLNGPEPMAMM